MESYSQFGQDIYLYENIYSKKNEGYFVEVGAHDGIKYSNTLLLEQKGWKGVCIEPHPEIFKLLKKNRPNCFVSEYAAYKENNQKLEFIMSGLECGCSGFVYSNSHEFIKNNKRCIVETKTLTKLLDEINAPNFIEYISLDTEGSEFDILQGLDFHKYKVGYFSIEHNNIAHNRIKIRDYLISKGYVFHRQNNIDDDYILLNINL